MSHLPASVDIERIRQKINGLRARLQKVQDDAWSLFRHGEREARKVKEYYTAALVAKKSKLAQLLGELPAQYVAGWQDVRWLSWEADTVRQERLLRELRVGEMVEQKENIAVPGYVPFIGGNRTLIIACNNATSAQALELLQSLVIRTSLLLPHDSRYRLLDPAGLGQAFPMQSYLLQAQIPVETNGHDVARDLETVIEDIKSINRTMLTPSITSFDQVPHENRVNWRYQLIFVADFPRIYDERAIKILQQIGDAGPRAGVYLFIHWNRHYDLPRDMKGKDEELFANAFFLNLKYVSNNFRYVPDQAPKPTWQEQIFIKLSQSKQQEEHIDWERYVGLKQTDWWNASASLRIETPVGLGRGGKLLEIWFGERNRDIQTHGVLAGMTGSGKSNFCHALICGLAVRYSPDALRLYLIDGKQGVEFKVYSDLPHAEVVSLHSEAELSRNVLAELVREMERRNNEFFKPEGVTTLAEYHHKGQRRGNLPRILLLIDEYQELFEQDHDGNASRYLRHLAQKGRNAGIHIVLASTRYTVSDMQYRGDILNNIQLRMMLKMTDAEVQTLEDFGPRGKSLLQRLCDKSGMVVIKDQLGDDDSAYRPGKVAFLDKDTQLPRIVKELGSRDARRPIVFDGKEQPRLCANPQFQRLLNAQTWLDAQGMENYAHAPIRAGGLGEAEWYEIEVPRVCWLGQEFNVHGHANIIFRRRSRQNVVLLGEANPPRYGMLTAMLAGLSVSGNPDNTKFMVMDFSPTGAEWSDILLKVAEKLPADFTCHTTKASDLAQVYLADLINVLDERKQLRGEQLMAVPSIFLLLADADRVDELKRQTCNFDVSYSQAGEDLKRLLVEGPEKGIHLILSFSSIRKMEGVLEVREALEHVQHRVALRMAENDLLRFGFVQSRHVAELQSADSEPICALYLDIESSKDVLFKPYIVDSSKATSITRDIEEIGQQLRRRSRTP